MADQSRPAAIEVYLTVADGNAAIAYYRRAFGALENFRQLADDGRRLLHANLSVFGGQIMLSDEFPEHTVDVRAPTDAGGASVTIHVNLENADDVDRVLKNAADAGGTITMPADDMFWGMRYGRLRDPMGHVWSFGAPTVTPTA
jgi:PhnB protein